MSDNETQPFPISPESSEDTMSDTTALLPIQGSNAFEQHIQVDPSAPLDLSVTNASGRLEVVATDTTTVHVIVNRTDGQDEDEPQIVISVDGNHISVRPSWVAASGISAFAKKLKDQLQNGLNTNDWKFDGIKFSTDLDYNIWVEVPRTMTEGSRFNLKTASGRASAKGLRDNVMIASASGRIDGSELTGQIATHSASGSIHLANVNGKLEANTASGSITVQGGEAWTILRSVSGSVTIDRFTLRDARITTVSGSVRGAAIVNNTAEYQIETVSGSVKMDLVLPSDSTSTLNYKSMSGSAKPSGFVMTGKNTWTVGSGPQGPAIRVRTVSGSLKLDAHAESSIPTRNDAPPQPTLDVADDDQATAPYGNAAGSVPPVPPVPPIPAVPPVPPVGAQRVENDDPLFTPPSDWPAWIKETARHVEETARHVVTSFQQPVTPFETTSEPSRPAPSASAPSAAPSVPPTPQTNSAEGSPTRTITFVPKDDDAVEPEAPVDTTQLGDQDEAERLRILEAVERGEVDIDEALARFENDATPRA